MAWSAAQIQSHMAASPFIAWTGMTVTLADAEAEVLKISMPFQAGFERALGTTQFHGGPIASLIDTAGCYVLVMLKETPLPTINFRTDYLRPASATDLHATATVRRAGRTVGVVDVDVNDDAGKLVAVGRGAFGTFAG